VLLLSLVAFPVAQFVLFPLVAGFSMRLGMLAVEGLLLAGTVLLIRRRGWVLEDLLLLNAVPRPVLLATPVAAVGAALLATGLDGRVAIGLEWLNLGAPASLQRSLLEIQLITDPLTAVLVPLSIVLVPAVCEEAFFRGYVLTGLRYHHGPVTAVVGSAVVFAAAHVNPWQFPALFALGLFLAALVHWTHSLYPAVIGHAVNNSLSVAAVNLRAYTGIDSLGAVDPLSAAGITAGAAALAVGVRSLLKSRPIMPLLAPHTRPAPADGLPGLA
jgi:membrane protease YdiL (CAAX protease family)